MVRGHSNKGNGEAVASLWVGGLRQYGGWAMRKLKHLENFGKLYMTRSERGDMRVKCQKKHWRAILY